MEDAFARGVSRARLYTPRCDRAHPTLLRIFYNQGQTIVIVGLRTAGAYFAPLMALYLKRSNWSRVAWFSIRPKSGISVWEQWQLRSAARHDSRVLVVDDYPATGKTLRLTLEILQKSKIKPERISVLAPTHAAEPHWM